MSENKSEYEKKITKANAARNRQIERQKEKLASADYQKKLQDKQKASQSRAYEKMQARMANPDYINDQWEKKLKAAEKQKARLQVKESTPEYISKQIDKKISQAKALQEKSFKKSSSKFINKLTRSTKSKGLAGRNATVIEKRLANKIGDIGCICCLNKSWYTTQMQEQEGTKFISLHHIDGRTKPWAHAKVLPLCAYHHDVPAPSYAPSELTPIHRGNKKEWVEFNGTEEALLKQVYEMIEEDQPWLFAET